MTTFALKSCDSKTATSKVQFVKHLLSFGSVSPVGGSVALMFLSFLFFLFLMTNS